MVSTLTNNTNYDTGSDDSWSTMPQYFDFIEFDHTIIDSFFKQDGEEEEEEQGRIFITQRQQLLRCQLQNIAKQSNPKQYYAKPSSSSSFSSSTTQRVRRS